MNKSTALGIANLLSSVNTLQTSDYVLKDSIVVESLKSFHSWADDKPCLGAFLFDNKNGEAYWLLLIDWRRKDNFYVVLYPESKTGPIAEIHKYSESERTLNWQYSPSKRDGRNNERKLYFQEAFLTDNVQISIPSGPYEIDDFLEELFCLAKVRLKADQLECDYSIIRDGFPEGKIRERLHITRERNVSLIKKAKELAIKKKGLLECACCGFNFFEVYGEIGKNFIEAHHTVPVSSLHEDGEITNLSDLALVCSNCHRMLHRRRPWLEIDNIKSLLIKKSQDNKTEL